MSKSTSVVGGAFPCSRCDRAFISKPALTMHINRVHSRKVRVPGQKMDREELLAKKRAYNRKYRLRKGMKVRPLSLKEAQEDKKAREKGASWTPERRARFERSRRNKMKFRNNHTLDLGPEPEKLTSRRSRLGMGEVRIPNNYCENCGHDQVPAQLAKGFMRNANQEHRHGG